MVCTANDLQAWTDFPKGLRVLLLDQDTDSSSEIRSKLEAMDYVVSTFCDENEALSAIANEPDSFHIAIVEVNTSSDGSFNFLGSTRDLPIIMMSSNRCLSTMMKCIALGAVEFLHKPLCEDKLRNIWQHVVHKAFNAGVGTISETLRPVKQSVASMLHLQSENGIHKNDASMEMVSMSVCETDNEQSAGSDKYPAPSTPQLKQGARLLDDGDCHDQTNCSVEKESTDPDEESKFVDMTCDESGAQNLPEGLCQDQRLGQGLVKGEDESADNTNCETAVSPNSQSKYGSHGSHGCNNNPSKRTGLHNSTGTRVNRKKMKVDWTAELHKKFVQAVEQLGVDQAIPSRILELMKVEGLTRHNVASHLQKYRMHKRHILPKEDDRRWPHHRDVVSRSYYPHRPIMAYPPYHSSHPLQPGTVYPIWPPAPPLPLPPGNHPTGMQMWCPPGYPPWHAHYPGMHADAWGCPVLPPSHGPAFTFPAQSAPGNHYAGAVDHGLTGSSTFDYHLAEEVVDKVVKEAISKPWLPLPLGLKPPSTDCVLAELTRQGIPCIPPRSVHP